MEEAQFDLGQPEFDLVAVEAVAFVEKGVRVEYVLERVLLSWRVVFVRNMWFLSDVDFESIEFDAFIAVVFLCLDFDRFMDQAVF